MPIDWMAYEDEIADLKKSKAKAEAENERLEKNYYDLIYQVVTCFPNETRHETAKRYIQQAENRPAQCSAAPEGGKQDGS